jgi:hypothetical protein
MKINPLKLWLATTVASLVLTRTAPAQVIFNNSTNDLLTRFVYTGNEIGDEIILAGSERYLTNFSFEFFGTNLTGTLSYGGTPEARVKFYLNDGATFNGYSTPSSNFFDSGWFSIGTPTPRSTAVFDTTDFGSGGLFMPVFSNFTWSVQFRSLGANDQVGVDLYDPPVVGADYPDYWENSGGSWLLKTNNAVPVNFAAVFIATVPEPTSAGLLMLGGFGLAAAAIRLRSKQ